MKRLRSRVLATVLVAAAVLSALAGWGYVALFRSLNLFEAGTAFSGFIGSLGTSRLLTGTVVLLVCSAVVLAAQRRPRDAAVTAVLAVATVVAFVATPLPLVRDTFTVLVAGDALNYPSLVVAAVVSAIVALGAVVLGVRAWRAGSTRP